VVGLVLSTEVDRLSDRVRSGALALSLRSELDLDSDLVTERRSVSFFALPFSLLVSLADLVACG
jgi:hypothetical protein